MKKFIVSLVLFSLFISSLVWAKEVDDSRDMEFGFSTGLAGNAVVTTNDIESDLGATYLSSTNALYFGLRMGPRTLLRLHGGIDYALTDDNEETILERDVQPNFGFAFVFNSKNALEKKAFPYVLVGASYPSGLNTGVGVQINTKSNASFFVEGVVGTSLLVSKAEGHAGVKWSF